MRTLLIDNYDSFTFNLYQLLAQVNGVEPIVVHNDCASWAEIRRLKFDNIVISPGPGRPDLVADFGICAQAIREAQVPVLGVCLGHQGICHLFGAAVENAAIVMHGQPSRIHHNGQDLFAGIPSPFTAIRYHSLHVPRLSLELERMAWTEDGILMGVRHRYRPIWGVQFHPESIGTQYGEQLLKNFRTLTAERAPRYRAGRQPVSSTSAYTVVPEAAAPLLPRKPPLKLFYRQVAAKVDAERAFVSLFADSQPAFWLDSALASHFSRFSYMGDGAGPHAQLVTYDVSAQRVQVRHQDRTTQVNESLFDYLQRMLREHRVQAKELPFDFNCGYVGYLSYEMKADCGAKAAHRAATADAVLLFADRLIVLDHRCDVAYLLCLDEESQEARAQGWLNDMAVKIQNLPLLKPWHSTQRRQPVPQTLRHSPREYLELIAQCQKKIKQGESYEICLTNMIESTVDIEPLHTYRTLRASNAAPYSAYLRFANVSVLSASPERFLRISPDGLISSRPIKGTRPRAETKEEDIALREGLRTNPKDRAENLMIVDLVRNDLGKVCAVGSVRAEDLFEVETYATVHQLVSSIQGQLRPGISAVQAVQAAFPAGSMTGAPKLRTMEILDRLEGGARGVYSGAIGFLGLNGSADMSVAIRTMVVTNGKVSIGCGGAIIDLSNPIEEVEEMLLKSRALLQALSN